MSEKCIDIDLTDMPMDLMKTDKKCNVEELQKNLLTCV